MRLSLPNEPKVLGEDKGENAGMEISLSFSVSF